MNSLFPNRIRKRHLRRTAVTAVLASALIVPTAPAIAVNGPVAQSIQPQLSSSLPGNPSGDSPFVTSGKSVPFDRQAAAKWAKDHAEDDQPLLYASCTWFVTKALWAGGLPKNPKWTDEGSHGRIRKVPGTIAATAVQPFLDQLFYAFPASQLKHLSMTQNRVNEARAGDLIVYSWDGKTWDHLAIITDITDDGYPLVSEWGVLGEEYEARGWTWSKKNDNWLQAANPDMQAALVRIDTTVPTRY